MAKENHNKNAPAPALAGSGYGGKMTDDDVRRATQILGEAISAMYRKRGWQPMTYRTEEEGEN